MRAQLQLLYEMLDAALEVERKTRRLMGPLGARFPEIARRRTVPGVGAIGAHLFVAYVREPTRFETPQQLWRYGRLGIRDRSSDGKPLGFQQLDRCGHGVLKALSDRAWLVAVKQKRGAVHQLNTASLARTGNEVPARLNTQRKILHTLMVLWARGGSSTPNDFSEPRLNPPRRPRAASAVRSAAGLKSAGRGRGSGRPGETQTFGVDAWQRESP